MTVSTGGPPTAAAAAAAGAAEPGAWTAAKAGAHRPRVIPAGSKAAERRGHFMAATPLPGVGEICRSSCLPAWLMCNERMRVARACATHTHVWTDRRAEDLLGGATIVANLWRFARHVWSNFDNPGAERRRLGQDAPGRRPPPAPSGRTAAALLGKRTCGPEAKMEGKPASLSPAGPGPPRSGRIRPQAPPVSPLGIALGQGICFVLQQYPRSLRRTRAAAGVGRSSRGGQAVRFRPAGPAPPAGRED